jgi:hypothetical protein
VFEGVRSLDFGVVVGHVEFGSTRRICLWIMLFTKV